MPRRATAHDLAAYARCPRAWWYERRHPAARLDVPALRAELQERRAQARGRGADAEVEVFERLLARQRRFAHGRQVHRQARHDAAVPAPPRGLGCLLPAALLLLALLLLVPWL